MTCKLCILGAMIAASITPPKAWNTISSWYSTKECAKSNPSLRTASGEVLDDNALTCAHPTLPFNTLLRVSYNNKSVTVRVNDRGPNKRLIKQGRALDLTRRAFRELAPLRLGIIIVKVEQINTTSVDSIR